MELSVRLQMNADLVPEGTGVGDIGCDHGYVSIYLARHKGCSRVIAMDVNQGPLGIARKNIERASLSGCIECRLSDGMEKLLPGEVDVLLIAGMGGMLICQILKKYPAVLKEVQTLVLQPQSDIAQVRKCIHELGFFIEKEKVCRDAGKYYFAFRAVRGYEKIEYTEAEYHYGRLLLQEKNRTYQEYLLSEKAKTEHIREQLASKDTKNAKERIQELSHILNRIDEALSCF